MIAIFGTNHDDILYFESIMTNRVESTILRKFKISTGNIFNQEVVIVDGNYSSILSAAISSYVFSHYHIDLAYIVGRGVSISKNLKTGDIVISNQIINIDVDLVEAKNVILGQIPGFQQEFKIQSDLIGYLNDALNKRAYLQSKSVLFLSSDDYDNKALEKIRENYSSLAGEGGAAIVDHCSGGIALSGALYDVPVVGIRVVEKQFGTEWDVNNYLLVLDRYVALGKAVVSSIGDIGRNDVLYYGGYGR